MTCDNLLYLSDLEHAVKLHNAVLDKRDRLYAGYKQVDAVKKMVVR